jgi:hypothetical protein
MLATGVVGPLCLAISWLLPMPSNCGGNSLALHRMGSYARIATFFASESPTGEFRVEASTALQRLDLTSSEFWMTDARLYVSREPYRSSSDVPRHIVCVCDRAYTNIPQRRFGRSPPAHAVAYSDGTTGLISVTEFRALDLSRFVALDELE